MPVLTPTLVPTLIKLSFTVAFDPAGAFGGNSGTWISFSDTADLFQEDTGITPVTTDGDPVGLINDNSGNGIDGYQPTAGNRLTFKTDGTYNWGLFDVIDDVFLFDVPVGGWSGTYVQGTTVGTIVGEISVPAGTISIPSVGYGVANGTITDLIIIDDGGTIDPSVLTNLVEYVDQKSPIQNVVGITSLVDWFVDRSEFTSLDLTAWDVSSVTNMSQTFLGCTNLISLGVNNWDTSGVGTFNSFANGCSSLTTLDVSGWDVATATNFQNFIRDCSSLVSLDVSGWTTTLAANLGGFAWGCSALTTLDVSGWNMGNVTNVASFARDCTSLTILNVSGWNTSSITLFSFFISGSTSISSLDVSNWNTSSATTFQNFASGATSLATVTVTGGTGNPFADSTCTNYTNAFTNTNLTQQSIDDILVAIDTAGTSSGTFNQSGGSAPSATGEAAITSLRGRGWTVTVTGGF